MLDKQVKQKIIEKFRQHDDDTGSTPVQIAILTEEIKQLTDHLQKHRQDFSSRRGLLRKVGERRRLLKYLQKEDEQAFLDLATKLNLRIAKKMAADEERRRLEEEESLAKGQVDNEDEEFIDEEDEDDLEKEV